MIKEKISVLVDGEFADDEIGEVIDTLIRDSELQHTWSRYHLIGEALRADALPSQAAAASTINQGRDNVVPLADKRRSYTPLAGLAIAASVAALAVTLALRPSQQPTAPEFQVATTMMTQPLTPDPIDSIRSESSQAVVAVGAFDQRLNGYLVNFNEQRTRLGVPAVHPYVRIVGFEAE